MRPLALLLVAGCGAAPAPGPIDHLGGEVHLHQFPPHSHAWAAFLPEPVHLHHVHHDQLVTFDFAPVAREGACALYVRPTCAGGCPAGTRCSATDTCTAATPVRFVDGGEVTVGGSRTVPAIRLWFDPASQSYLSDPAPGPVLLFEGGEPLDVRGGRGDLAFSGRVPAPPPLAITRPDPAAPLAFPTDAPLEVAWVAEGAHAIILNLAASGGGRSTYIRCVTADVGALTVPRSLVAALAPSPREIHFQLERDEERLFAAARPGLGVIVHAAVTRWRDATQ